MLYFGGDNVRINTTIRKDFIAPATKIRSEMRWADFIHACINLWINDVKFNNKIRRFKKYGDRIN